MSETDKTYIAQYAKKTTFEMATVPGQYETRPCYLVESIAICRDGKEWKMSHAATGMGMPGIFGRSLIEAVRVARAIDGCIEWSKVKRTKTVGVARGLTRKRFQAISAMALTFRHIAERSRVSA